MKHEEKKQTLLKKLAERLHDPLQFRIFVTVVILGIGYAGVYTPLSDRISRTTREIKKEREHQQLRNDIEKLRSQVKRVVTRLPKNVDTNEWIQYVLGGVRDLPIKLRNLDSNPPRMVGPYTAVVLRVELVGDYSGLESFLYWIETNERLFRIDGMKLAMARSGDALELKVTLLGLQE
ncbi:MAG TPA: type 4a pilus biogenesis protein PilO [Thermoguttaceae bacterium]|nr:type 4a pilus biogenesis protein PilO [Thermoguttaceae bacterium]